MESQHLHMNISPSMALKKDKSKDQSAQRLRTQKNERLVKIRKRRKEKKERPKKKRKNHHQKAATKAEVAHQQQVVLPPVKKVLRAPSQAQVILIQRDQAQKAVEALDFPIPISLNRILRSLMKIINYQE